MFFPDNFNNFENGYKSSKYHVTMAIYILTPIEKIF